MPVRSAGILPYRRSPEGLVVLVGHMGGPFWARKDEAAWSVLKGEVEDGEDAESAARREFLEESGITVDGPLERLCELRMSSGKRVEVFTCEAPEEWVFTGSSTFELEWPPRSGRTRTFPEIDRAQWLPLDDARRRLVRSQRPALDVLVDHVAD